MKKISEASPLFFQLNSRKLTLILLLVMSIFVTLSIAVNAGLTYYLIENENHARVVKQFFNLDAEYNPPTFFSFCLLFASALLLYMIYLVKRQKKKAFTSYWGFLSLIFLYLGLDEILVIHEKFSFFSGMLLGVEGSDRYYLWVLPFSIPLFYFIYRYIPFLRQLPPVARFGFVRAGAIYVGGAFGMEIIGAFHQSFFGYGFYHSLIFTLEESMEMLGIILFINALQNYWSDEIGETHLVFSPKKKLYKSSRKRETNPVSAG